MTAGVPVDILTLATIAWMTVLVGASALLVVRARSVAGRILALDTLVMLLIGVLALFAHREGAPHYLDAALVLALLSFAATLAAARYHGEDRIF